MPDSEDRISVRLTQEEYQTLKEIIRREEAYSYLKKRLTGFWIWTVAGGILTIFALWDSIKIYLTKV